VKHIDESRLAGSDRVLAVLEELARYRTASVSMS
jgi:hypothetical protein